MVSAKRRRFLLAAATSLVAPASAAQTAARLPRVGMVFNQFPRADVVID